MELSNTTISTSTESTFKTTKSSLTESVLKRLDSFGCAMTEASHMCVLFSIEKVENNIKNECNVTEIPEGLVHIVIDRVCGEVLSALYGTKQLALSTLNLDGAIASVTVGGSSVSFDNEMSDEGKMKSLIQVLRNSGEGELACYRRIRW